MSKSKCVKELWSVDDGDCPIWYHTKDPGDVQECIKTRLHTAPDYLYTFDAAITRAINKERNEFVKLGLTVARDQLRENVKNEIGYNIETGEVVSDE